MNQMMVAIPSEASEQRVEVRRLEAEFSEGVKRVEWIFVIVNDEEEYQFFNFPRDFDEALRISREQLVDRANE